MLATSAMRRLLDITMRLYSLLSVMSLIGRSYTYPHVCRTMVLERALHTVIWHIPNWGVLSPSPPFFSDRAAL